MNRESVIKLGWIRHLAATKLLGKRLATESFQRAMHELTLIESMRDKHVEVKPVWSDLMLSKAR